MCACVLAHSLTLYVNAEKCLSYFALKSRKAFFKNTRWMESSNLNTQRWTTENSKHFDKMTKINFIVSLYCQRTVIETIIARDSVPQPLSHNQLHGLLLSFIVTLQFIAQIFVLFFCSRTKRRAGAKRWDISVMILVQRNHNIISVMSGVRLD